MCRSIPQHGRAELSSVAELSTVVLELGIASAHEVRKHRPARGDEHVHHNSLNATDHISANLQQTFVREVAAVPDRRASATRRRARCGRRPMVRSTTGAWRCRTWPATCGPQMRRPRSCSCCSRPRSTGSRCGGTQTTRRCCRCCFLVQAHWSVSRSVDMQRPVSQAGTTCSAGTSCSAGLLLF